MLTTHLDGYHHRMELNKNIYRIDFGEDDIVKNDFLLLKRSIPGIKFIDTSSKFGVRLFLCSLCKNSASALILRINMVHSRQWRRMLFWERSGLGIDRLDVLLF